MSISSVLALLVQFGMLLVSLLSLIVSVVMLAARRK